MKKQYFTLVELLVVIGIIAILAGIAIPSAGKAIKRARITQARTEITNIVNAVNAFENAYSVLPALSLSGSAVGTTNDLVLDDVRDDVDDPFKSSDNNKSDSKVYDAMMQILAAQDISSSDVTSSATEELWSTKTKRDNAKDAKGNALNLRNLTLLNVPQQFKEKGLRDPWGTRYVVMLDANYDGKISDFPSTGKDLRGSVFVYSYGPDRKSNDGQKGTDDINSWDVQ